MNLPKDIIFTHWLLFVAANEIDIPEMDCQTEDLSDVGEKRKLILLVKDEDGKLGEVKLWYCS